MHSQIISSSSGTELPLYSQCGGLQWTASKNCGSKAKCVMQNVYYSQCVPLSSGDARSAIALYSQCGGQNWTGGTMCVSNAKCVYINAYFSQCMPK